MRLLPAPLTISASRSDDRAHTRRTPLATTEQTMMKVQRLLTGPLGLHISLNAENIQVRFNDSSTAINLSVKDWGVNKEGEPETLVYLWAPVLREVRPSPEVFEWIAREGGTFWFGHVRAVDGPAGTGTVTLIMEHTLLGDFLDARELEAALYGIIGSADRMDDELKERFGGKRWTDD